MGKDLKGEELGAGYLQRKDGRYQKVFYAGGERHTVYGVTFKECKAAYKTLLVAIENGDFSRAESVTLDKYFYRWLEQQLVRKSIKGSSYALYKRLYAKHISTHLGKKRVDKIKPVEVEDIQTKMIEEEYSPKTINSVLGLLNSVFKDMVKKDIVVKNPCRALTMLKEGEKTRTNARYLTAEEEAAFLEASKDSWYYNAIRLLFATGMRSGELRGLQWRDFDTKKRVLHIRRTASVDKEDKLTMQSPKTENGVRDIPMNEDIISIIRDQKHLMKDFFGEEVIALNGHIFLSTTGKVISRNVLKSDFNRISERVAKKLPGFERVSPHACRHTFITKNITAGYNEYVVKDVVGHAHSAKVTTDVYLHRNAEAMRDFMQSIGTKMA